MTVPDVAIGAIVAAVIGSAVSLVGLIISKEQKTSEFRQIWIDQLRKSITEYASRINAITDAVRADFKDYKSKVNALHEHYIPLNSATFDILLRVNPKEQRSKRLIATMDKFNALFLNEENITAASIRPLELELLSASQELLKYEWNRVKSGEIAFRLAKYTALILVVAFVGLGMWAFVKSQDVQTARPAILAPPAATQGSVAPNVATESATPEKAAPARGSSPQGGS